MPFSIRFFFFFFLLLPLFLFGPFFPSLANSGLCVSRSISKLDFHKAALVVSWPSDTFLVIHWQIFFNLNPFSPPPNRIAYHEWPLVGHAKAKNMYATRIYAQSTPKITSQMRIMACRLHMRSHSPHSHNTITHYKIETTFSTLTLLLWIIRVNIIRLSLTPSSAEINVDILLHTHIAYACNGKFYRKLNFTKQWFCP